MKQPKMKKMKAPKAPKGAMKGRKGAASGKPKKKGGKMAFGKKMPPMKKNSVKKSRKKKGS